MSELVQSIIIDADPGQDDAVALLLAFAARSRLDIRAITTVAGNVPVALTTANALRIRDLAGRSDVPVIAGMAGPMVLALETAEFLCGPDGLAGADLPAPQSSAEPGHAVAAIIRLLRAAEPGSVTLAALGPLSNVAMALRLAPDIVPALARIVVMGGALGLGNMTPAAEFNFYVDPHAARVVLEAGISTTLFGLHATHQALASPEHLRRLRGLDNRAGSVTHAMLNSIATGRAWDHGPSHARPLCDRLAALARAVRRPQLPHRDHDRRQPARSLDHRLARSPETPAQRFRGQRHRRRDVVRSYDRGSGQLAVRSTPETLPCRTSSMIC